MRSPGHNSPAGPGSSRGPYLSIPRTSRGAGTSDSQIGFRLIRIGRGPAPRPRARLSFFGPARSPRRDVLRPRGAASRRSPNFGPLGRPLDGPEYPRRALVVYCRIFVASARRDSAASFYGRLDLCLGRGKLRSFMDSWPQLPTAECAFTINTSLPFGDEFSKTSDAFN